MNTDTGQLASRIERLHAELKEVLSEAEKLEERAGGPICGLYVSGCVDQARISLAPARRALTENVLPEEERIRHLAYLALQAAGMARRLAPEVGSIQDATDTLLDDVEKAIRDVFEAVGVEGEIIPQSFVESASADARRRLKSTTVETS